nr:hypothetical protein [uncultured bacterium]
MENQISIKEILSVTMKLIIDKKKEIFESLKYPLLGIITLSLLNFEKVESFTIQLVIFLILSTYLYILITIKCHRIALLDEGELGLLQAFTWNSRCTNFLIATILLSFALGLLTLPTIMLLSFFFGVITNDNINFTYLMIIATVPAGYIFARLSLIFPAIATDRDKSFRYAWKLSKGNGWQLFFIVLLFPWLANSATGFLSNEHLFTKMILSIFGVLVLIFEVMILSKSYQYLTSTNKPNNSINSD